MCVAEKVLVGVAAVLGAGQAHMSAQAQQDSAYANAKLTRKQAENERRKKLEAEQLGLFKRAEREAQLRSVVGGQTAGLAAAGVVVGTGTAAQVVQNTRVMAMRQQEQIAKNTARNVAGIERQASAMDMQAQSYQSMGDRIDPFESALIGGFTAGMGAYGNLSEPGKQAVRRTGRRMSFKIKNKLFPLADSPWYYGNMQPSSRNAFQINRNIRAFRNVPDVF